MTNRKEYQRDCQKVVISKAERESFTFAYRKDERDVKTPYKVISSGNAAKRFKTEQEARRFYNLHDGRALLSVTKNQKIKYLAYKFS